MCGIVGVFGEIDKKLKNCFEDMHQMDVLRGDDSSGVAFIWPHGVSVVKDTSYPMWLKFEKKYQKNMDRNNLFGLIGHNRAATKGRINAMNAHPFTVNHITMVMNGTNHMQHCLEDHDKFENDSHNICHSIAKVGIDQTWKDNRNQDATIVYWNDKEKTLNIISNCKRPFYWRETKDAKAIIFSSEHWMLWGAANRREVELDIEGKSFTPAKNILYTFKFDKKVTMTSRELEEHKYVYSFNNQNNFLPFDKGDEWKREPPKKFEEIKKEVREKKMERVQFLDLYPACCHCGLPNDFDTSIILDQRNAICEDCQQTATNYGIDFNQMVYH